MLVTRIGRMRTLFNFMPLALRECGEHRVSGYIGVNVGEIDLARKRHHELKELSTTNDYELGTAAHMLERLLEAMHGNRT